MESATDEGLMGRYAQGEAEAFAALFDRYERRAFAFLRARCGSDDRARDLYQELFLRLHRSRHTFRTEERFAPWFFRIARSVLADEARRGGGVEVALDAEACCAPAPDALARCSDREEAERALAALTPEQLYVLVRAKVEGASYAEVAAQLGKSVAAVKQLASRALRGLRAAEACRA
jgi:RNA polymerase sigma-70 factor (ECF subfamily)